MSDQLGEFSFGTRLGLAFTVQSACCSALLVSSLLIYILYSAVTIKHGASRTWNVSTHVHYYFVNLLVFDLIQAIGGIIDVKWVAEAGVTEGALCTAQGILKQMGDVGVALSWVSNRCDFLTAVLMVILSVGLRLSLYTHSACSFSGGMLLIHERP
ncbi:hypothetical protein BT96DRAFT_26796 [Gymnopus androsaceus JB14]|uniref:Uncharacterized protein n=1 Tax=Gymnopus androsaceus JB14 TaxID=1447944 RepID=A0A6A4I852_9AGAR|nr:hypothetical protein BT96DRAFT_26796 [Gymnopus androsaceus JB14]